MCLLRGTDWVFKYISGLFWFLRFSSNDITGKGRLLCCLCVCYIRKHIFSENVSNVYEIYVHGCAGSMKDNLFNVTYLFCTLMVITIMEGLANFASTLNTVRLGLVSVRFITLHVSRLMAHGVCLQISG